MWAFISVMCFLGSLACLLGAVIALFQKKGLHTKYFILSGALFVFFIAAAFATPASSETPAIANRMNDETAAAKQPVSPIKEAPKAVPYQIFEDNKSEKRPSRNVRVMTKATTEAEYRQIVDSIRKDSMGFEYVWLYFHDTNVSTNSPSGEFIGAVRFPLTQRGIALSGAKDINELYFSFSSKSGKSPQIAKSEVAIDSKVYDEAAKKVAQEKRSGSISPSLESFKSAFNASAKKLGLSYQISKITPEGPDQDIFQVKFIDALILNGVINKKDGSLREAFIAGIPDGTNKSLTNMLFTFVALITATNPKLSLQECADIIKDLGLDEGQDIFNLKSSVIKNGIKYSVNSTKEFGIWFFAQDPNTEYN